MRAAKRLLLLALLACLSLSGAASTQEGDLVLHEAKLLAQQAAMPDLSGDEPFTLRESWWSGTISPGANKLIQQQLFRRNEYRFWFAVPNSKAVSSINIYNGEGELIDTEIRKYDRGNVVSTTIKPESTGIYYIRIAITQKTEGDEDWAVIYAYR